MFIFCFLSFFQATILVGIALLISNLITLAVANKMPRRLMLILSSFFISVALIGMGVYFHLKSLEKEACGSLRSNSSQSENPVVATICDSFLSDTSNHSVFSDEMDCAATYTQSLGKNFGTVWKNVEFTLTTRHLFRENSH